VTAASPRRRMVQSNCIPYRASYIWMRASLPLYTSHPSTLAFAHQTRYQLTALPAGRCPTSGSSRPGGEAAQLTMKRSGSPGGSSAQRSASAETG
jgi:hypothetical protein